MKSKEVVKLLVKHSSPENEVSPCVEGGEIIPIKEVLWVDERGYTSTTKRSIGNEIILVGKLTKT